MSAELILIGRVAIGRHPAGRDFETELQDGPVPNQTLYGFSVETAKTSPMCVMTTSLARSVDLWRHLRRKGRFGPTTGGGAPVPRAA